MAELEHLCREGLQALDRLLAAERPPQKDLLAEATRCMARLRDALIEQKRGGDEAAALRLVQANALLSELAAAEFPLVGLRRDRIRLAREHYRRLGATGLARR